MANINWGKVERSAARLEHKMVWHAYGYPAIASLECSCFHDAPISDPWDIPDKMVVSVAITGAFFRHQENPNQAVTDDSIRESAREVLTAGASTVHIHVRDENQHNTLSYQQFHNVIAPLKEEYPDLAIDGCLVSALDGDWEEMKRVLDAKLMDASPVNATVTYVGDSLMAKPIPMLMEKTRLIQESGGIPEIAVYTDADVSNADRYLIRSGLIEGPAVWLVLPALPGCSPMENPRQMVESLMRMVNAIRDCDPEGMILVCAAGRASMMLATFAASMGLHIRIGMEDTYYMWPHRDDKIQSNLQCFQLAQKLAEVVGRPIASRAEYRQMIGLPAVTTAA